MRPNNTNPAFDVDDEKPLSMSMSSQAKPSEKRIEADAVFSKVVENVRRAIEIDCFDSGQGGQAEELCMIIAEVLKLPPHAVVRIGGNDIPAEMVAEVYQSLEHEHIELVLDNFRKITYRITAKKTYLRTALYNVVFEYESHWENQVAMQFDGKSGCGT